MCNFCDPNLVAFYFYEYTHFRLNEEHFTFHLQHKHSGTFAKRYMKKYLTPKKSENVPPHSGNSIDYSQSSRENATPSSGTSPVASYKKVPSFPPGSKVIIVISKQPLSQLFLYLSLGN